MESLLKLMKALQPGEFKKMVDEINKEDFPGVDKVEEHHFNQKIAASCGISVEELKKSPFYDRLVGAACLVFLKGFL